ncbi:hypothetical protein H6P81_009416 [Aristolochia fimbriata]|uniref:Uncharacterized protein n=1 Tax=Aristolochia fimbriata TaxID=158543 RepID=A0AAV7ELX5_ARIFI|nr:hypothetical protein H6P81_009416 [Aristolochia fimbriata]
MLKGSLFDWLCPLLILRLLPLRVYSEVTVSFKIRTFSVVSFVGVFNPGNTDFVKLLIPFGTCEMELKFVQNVLLRIISFQMDIAAQVRDITKLKSCLFIVCTSFVKLSCFASERSSEVSLDEALHYIREHARGAVMRGEMLNEVLIPMIENALKQVFLLFHWLFQDELLIEPLSSNLAEIIFRKEDSYISLGWCFLVRGLVENELNLDNTSERGNLQWQKMLLKCVFQSIPRPLPIVCKGSILQDGFELPSRLSLAMADCILVLSRALVQEKRSSQVPNKSSTELVNLSRRSKIVAFVSGSAAGGNKRSSLSEITQGLEDMEMELLLWNHSSEIIIIVEKLLAWNRKIRLLHAKGLELVLKWLQGIKVHYTSLKDEAGEEMLKTGLLLLSSCWKHYGRLLQLEDHKFAEYYKDLLEQYIWDPVLLSGY